MPPAILEMLDILEVLESPACRMPPVLLALLDVLEILESLVYRMLPTLELLAHLENLANHLPMK